VRPPQAVAGLNDRSGSMRCRPMATARRWTVHVVGKLGRRTRCRWCSSTAVSSASGAWGDDTSTDGLGDSCDEDWMVAMACIGGGNHDCADTAEDLMDPLQQAQEPLGNLCMRDLRLSASAPGVIDLHRLNQLPAVDGGWRLPAHLSRKPSQGKRGL
jgi:hypothetical protein